MGIVKKRRVEGLKVNLSTRLLQVAIVLIAFNIAYTILVKNVFHFLVRRNQVQNLSERGSVSLVVHANLGHNLDKEFRLRKIKVHELIHDAFEKLLVKGLTVLVVELFYWLSHRNLQKYKSQCKAILFFLIEVKVQVFPA